MVMTAILMLALASGGGACDDFAADVARRAEMMAADVETMPHVVREGLRQLAHDAKARANREAEIERLREDLREIIRRRKASRTDGGADGGGTTDGR